MRRASFGSRIALCDVLARLVHGRVNASERHQRAAVGKAADVADLSDQLGGGDIPHAVHGPYRLVFGKLLSQADHFLPQDSEIARASVSCLAAVVISILVLLFLGSVV